MGAPASPISETIRRQEARRTWTAPNVDRLWRILLRGGFRPLWAVALLLLIPIKDTHPDSAQSLYEHAHQLFLHGDLTRTQQESEQGYRRFLNSDPEHAARFQLLAARTLIWRGLNEDALRALATGSSIFRTSEANIESLTLQGMANMYLLRFAEADRKLTEAKHFCEPPIYSGCGDVPIIRGVLAIESGHLAGARPILLEGLSLARTRHDKRSETSALLNLGVVALRGERYDDAVDWSNAAYRIAKDSVWEDMAENAMGNLGYAYYRLGDKEKALDLLLEAEKSAINLGSVRNEIKWESTAAYVYRDAGDLARAADAYLKSLDLANLIKSHEDIIDALEDLAHTDVMAGKLDEAGAYLDKLTPMVSGNRLDELDVMLARGEIAAARRDDPQAETMFRAVEGDSASQTSMRLGAEHQLARLYEVQGNTISAGNMYRTALTTFEAARADLKNEDSKLPFLTNATPIYDDYIHFLVTQGRAGEALAAADQSRAMTLVQGLGVKANKPAVRQAGFRASEVARKIGATVLFYWLGEKQSYLWAITPKKSSLFPLPRQAEITPLIESYRKALLEPGRGRGAENADGMALYRVLVAPAADLIAPNGNVIVVSDGPLSLLNFETLIVPGTAPHYWIEDANLVSAPSLYMLAAAKPSSGNNRRMLLMGDAVSPNPDYPELPMASAEMQKIQKHFAPAEETVFARQAANSGAYLKSSLRDYAYIHFVAHGVASRTDPLDSAIILSRTGAAEDSFKLHAREIIKHPIDARLVTISACYGGGTRSYAGEGLVGLSWAFLRAGAHNVIGALWEASDDSTPLLMDKMYAGLADGMSPSSALRQAKLALLHSEGKFKQPFYWAPFQIYAGL
jgi:CHAT domain-containing protein